MWHEHTNTLLIKVSLNIFYFSIVLLWSFKKCPFSSIRVITSLNLDFLPILGLRKIMILLEFLYFLKIVDNWLVTSKFQTVWKIGVFIIFWLFMVFLSHFLNIDRQGMSILKCSMGDSCFPCGGGQTSYLPIYVGKNRGPILSVGLGCSRA